MLPNFLFPIFTLFLFVNNTNACNCQPTTSFSLPIYDQSTFIVEIEVLEILEFPEEKLQQNPLQVDTLDGLNTTLPPPTPGMRKDFVDFRIKIIMDYKKNAETITLLRATNRSSSCYGGPEVGLRYLLYADGLETQEGFQTLVIRDACQRKMYTFDPRFEQEKTILNDLTAVQDGNFVIKHPHAENKILLSGKYKNGRRHGKWIAYDPDFGQEPQEIVRLRYRKGKEVRRKYNNKFNSPFADYYRSVWEMPRERN